MNPNVTLGPSQLTEFLLNVATVRPVFIWGPPGIGKSALVQAFAESLGLHCVSLLGSQLAPEDLIGVPQLEFARDTWCRVTATGQVFAHPTRQASAGEWAYML